MKERHIMVRFTTDELKRRREAAGGSLTDFSRLRTMTDAQVEVAARADNAAEQIPDDWYQGARPSLAKQPISIRLDQDLLSFFREQGPGWQTRINNVLRAYKEAVEKGAKTAPGQ